MKKILLGAFAAIVICLLMPTGIFDVPAKAATSGTTGDCTWTVNGFFMTISGNGAMADYSETSIRPWEEHLDDISRVIIEDGVTNVGDYAFYGGGVTGVNIPNSVTSIGNYAFYNIRSGIQYTNARLTIPNSVTSIGDYAFYGVPFVELTIPNSVTSIGKGAFRHCDRFTSLTIPNSIKSISDEAFSGCTKLTSITIPNSVTSIGDSAFWCCYGLTSVTIPDSVTIIGDEAFYLCSDLTNITIPNSVTSIGAGAFFNCNSLTSITIPDSVTSIGDSAFGNCTNLTRATIGNGVTSIGDSAFDYCKKLASVTIGNSVTSIGADAFRWCSSLTRITIPSSVTSIGEDAFRLCDALKNLYITDLSAWCNISFYNESSNPLCDGVNRNYGSDLYVNGTRTTYLIIPDGVTSIGKYAFYGSNELESIRIPDSVTSIGEDAFSGCYNLETLYYCGTEEQWNKITIDTGNVYLTDATRFYHDYEWIVDKSATCAETGIKHEKCRVCNAIRNINTIINTTGVHKTNWVIDKPATCVESGIKHLECTVCNAIYSEGTIIDATGQHIYDNVCDTDCNICSNIRTVDHVYTDICDDECDVCGHTRTAPHAITASFITNSTKYPFALNDGIYSSTNKVNSSSSIFTIEALYDHTIEIEYYTSTESGWDKLFIKHNSETLVTASGSTSWKTLSIDLKVGDTVTFTYSKDGSQSAYNDTVYFKFESTVPKDLFEPTCEDAVICGICGDTIKPALGHDYKIEVLEATCEAYGYTTYTCSVCGDSYTGNITTPTGHAWTENKVVDATCTAQGYTEYICNNCDITKIDDYTKPIGHSCNNGVVTAPTATAQGYTTYTCTVCGYSYKANYTDATGTVNGVQNMQVVATDTNITVSWDTPNNIVKYNLYVKNENGETLITRELSADRTSVTLSWPNELEWDKNYTIGIRAKTTKWLDTVYKEASLVVGNRIVDVKTQSVGRTIKVDWKAYEGATQYYVYVYKKGAYSEGAITNVKATTNSATIINAINPEIDYEVRVIATKGVPKMATADALSINARLNVFTPDTFTERGITPTKVGIGFDEVRGADKYWVYLTPVGGGAEIIKESTKAIAAVAGLASNTAYTVQIQARITDADGKTHYSGKSAVLGTITTNDWEDVNFTATKTSSGAKLTWDIPENAYSYIIYRSTNGGASYKKFATISDPAQASYIDAKAKSGYKYAIVTQIQDDFVSAKSPLIKSAAI